MIQAKDLMIGNWVYDGDKTQFPMQVVGIGTDYVYLDFEGNEGDLWESKPEDLQGVPLTPELLERLGARQLTEQCWDMSFYKAGVDVIIKIFFYSDSEIGVRIMSSTPHFTDIANSNVSHYLHQLQNLFRNIVKKDLVIQL